MDEKTWWVFRMPECTVYVPARSELDARAALLRDCYKGAPVHTWPLISTRVCSRQALTASLMRSRPPTSSGSSPTGTEA